MTSSITVKVPKSFGSGQIVGASVALDPDGFRFISGLGKVSTKSSSILYFRLVVLSSFLGEVVSRGLKFGEPKKSNGID